MTTRTVGYLVFLFGGVYLIFKYVLPYVLPFVVGMVIAFILEPVVDLLVRRIRISRAWAAIIVIVALVGCLSYLASWSIARIAAEVTDLYGYLPQYYTEFNRILSEVLRVAGDISQQLPEPLARAAQEQWNRLYSLLSVIVSGAGGVVKTLPRLTATTIFTFLSAYFLMKDRTVISEFMRSLLPAGAFSRFRHIEANMLAGIAGFVRAQAFLIVVTMIVNVVALSILGSRYAVALGLILAILDMLPVVGPGLIYLPWIAYHLVWGRVSYAVWLIVLYGSVSLMRQVVQTHLVGQEMGLHPLVTLVSLYIGVRLFGTPGLIYGPLTAILVKALWASGVIPHEGGASS